eukprot:evm.model.NODE_19184_length_12086_cov_51.707016.1
MLYAYWESNKRAIKTIWTRKINLRLIYYAAFTFIKTRVSRVDGLRSSCAYASSGDDHNIDADKNHRHPLDPLTNKIFETDESKTNMFMDECNRNKDMILAPGDVGMP